MEEYLFRSQELVSHIDERTSRDSRLMHNLNRTLRTLLEKLPDSDSVAFFCECQNQGCYAAVWMSVSAFDAAVTRNTSWLLSEGHDPSTLWREHKPSQTSEIRVSRELSIPRGGLAQTPRGT